MKPIEAKSGSGQQLSSSEIEQKVEVAPWRYGPAAYWYDQMGVNETGDKFDYGFRGICCLLGITFRTSGEVYSIQLYGI